ncbi:hypothetical protein AAVH_40110, partial [Aphelenchoides avenae]
DNDKHDTFLCISTGSPYSTAGEWSSECSPYANPSICQVPLGATVTSVTAGRYMRNVNHFGEDIYMLHGRPVRQGLAVESVWKD